MHNGRINNYILTGIQDKLKRLEHTIEYANGDNLLTILNLIEVEITCSEYQELTAICKYRCARCNEAQFDRGKERRINGMDALVCKKCASLIPVKAKRTK